MQHILAPGYSLGPTHVAIKIGFHKAQALANGAKLADIRPDLGFPGFRAHSGADLPAFCN